MRQGRFPRLRWVRWGLFAVLVVLILGATGPQALDRAAGWLRDEYERIPWYTTRISALLSYLALSASTIYGLLLSTKLLDRVAHRPVSFTLHQDLAGIGIALALVHAAVLMIDRSVPYTPFEVVIPFAGPYRPLWVGIGQLTMGLALVVMLSFYVRKRLGTRAWRSIHYLSFAAFVGATVHGLMAGSDTSAGWVYAGYLTLTVVVVFLATYRIVLAVGARKGGPDKLDPAASKPRGQRRPVEPAKHLAFDAASGAPAAAEPALGVRRAGADRRLRPVRPRRAWGVAPSPSAPPHRG
jgi:DMSO/TMAO reductase YedYZ heme-binding membrane subunit